MRYPVGLAALLLATGCATTPVPVVTPARVNVPVPVSCVTEVPARPGIANDADLAALPDGPLVLALHRDRLALRAWASELEALLAACR